jgi:hypothetical protein
MSEIDNYIDVTKGVCGQGLRVLVFVGAQHANVMMPFLRVLGHQRPRLAPAQHQKVHLESLCAPAAILDEQLTVSGNRPLSAMSAAVLSALCG